MRFVVVGAGAIGCVVGARLHQSGHDVTLVGRGRHLKAIQQNGLKLETPLETKALDIPAVGSVANLVLDSDTTVLLTTKSQDTAAALDQLRNVTDRATPVVCVQNGVENERMALRLFENVYGVAVMCPCAFLEPGLVQAFSEPVTGILDLGRYPEGADDTARQIAAALEESTFVAAVRPDIMRWKYGKLIRNLRNAIEAACGPDARDGRIRELVTNEAQAVLGAAGIDYITEGEDRARRGDILQPGRIEGRARPGGSVWQSLARGAGTVEVDYLSGHIVLLGRVHGIPTPANTLLQSVVTEMAAGLRPPRSLSEDEFLVLLER